LAADRDVLILAAASTIDALGDALAEHSQATKTRARASYGPTSTLARQIVAGAPADLLLAASRSWADYVAERRPVAARRSLAGNRVVVVASAQSALNAQADLASFAANPRLRRVAIADPEAVPAGIYAREAIESSGLWRSLEPRLLPTLDVRAALALAASGEADAAFVYASDAAAEESVKIIVMIEELAHSPIEYPLLLLNEDKAEAVRLFDFLTSERGRWHFLEHGFTPAGEGSF
jgi:molybdate transport system substrate-binding protein